MTDEQHTEELKALQLDKETTEDALARTAPDDSEVSQHVRRADKARYLREKLAEREKSEREAEESEEEPAADGD